MAHPNDLAHKLLAILIEDVKNNKEKFYSMSYPSQLRLIIMMLFTDTDGSNIVVADEFAAALEEKHPTFVEDLAIMYASKKK